MEERIIEHDNIFYIGVISSLGGVETYVYELAKKYKDYDIAIVCKYIAPNQKQRLKSICPVYVHTNEKIKCKTIITNCDSSILDFTEAETICETIHADYTDPHYKVYPKIDKRINHWLGITKHICRTFKEKFGVNTELCYNPLEINENLDKPLILISATRLTAIKGVKRMIALRDSLDKKGINYLWFIFSNENLIGGDNIVYMKPTTDIRRWIKVADYLVQLSDNEACSYSINESLVMGTPIIVTPLPYLEEIGIKDGVNSYILEFDLSNLDSVVDRIQDVPKFEFSLPKDNYDKYVVKDNKSKYKEMMKMKYLVKTVYPFFDMKERKQRTPEDEPFEITLERVEELKDIGKSYNKTLIEVIEKVKKIPNKKKDIEE